MYLILLLVSRHALYAFKRVQYTRYWNMKILFLDTCTSLVIIYYLVSWSGFLLFKWKDSTIFLMWQSDLQLILFLNFVFVFVLINSVSILCNWIFCSNCYLIDFELLERFGKISVKQLVITYMFTCINDYWFWSLIWYYPSDSNLFDVTLKQQAHPKQQLSLLCRLAVQSNFLLLPPYFQYHLLVEQKHLYYYTVI